MSWLFSQALVEEYLGENFLDGEQSAPLSGNPIQQAYCAPDKMTDFSRLSRFGMTYKPLTEDRGEELLTLFRAGFHAKTSQLPGKEPELTGNDQECGGTWRGSFVKYDQDLCLWKTHQCSLLGDLEQFLETWPQWGLMRDGECWDLSMLTLQRTEIDCGLLPAPLATDWKETGKIERQAKCWTDKNYGHQKRPAMFYAASYNAPMPVTFTEYLMGFPLEWTDLKPLEMHRFRHWQQEHGKC
jgi:hypothetical protein